MLALHAHHSPLARPFTLTEHYTRTKPCTPNLCPCTALPHSRQVRIGGAGSVGAYVNPAGFVHQTVTLAQVCGRGLRLVGGRPTAEDSWFPGYGRKFL